MNTAKNRIYFLTYIILIFTILWSCDNKINVKKKTYKTGQIFNIAQKHYKNMLQINLDSTRIPRTSSNKDSSLVTVPINDWTSGFYAGTLWCLYQYSKDDFWKQEAEKWTSALEPIQYLTNTHDVGFMMNCSFGTGYKITKDSIYKNILIQSAKSLSTRYSPITKSIKSWERKTAWDGKTEWYYPVIIDNMMNLELLFAATRFSNDSTFYNIAVNHAETTMKNHYRDDFSCYHVVDYDTLTGVVKDKATRQGFSDESAWARGQAWGLYGYTVVYRETKNPKYLQFADNIASFIMNHPRLPEDKIPYWDFDAGVDGFTPEWEYNPAEYPIIPRDVSAAAIIASALYELSNYSMQNKEKYKEFANDIVESLSTEEYLAEPGTNNNFILKHSVGSLPHGVEVDVPLNYADYYFLEALLRKKELETE